MANRFELSYVYARICGFLSGAFLGRRAAELGSLGGIPELWRRIFKDSPPALPEALLLAAAESRAVGDSLSAFRILAESLRADDPFVDMLRRKSEFARVKKILLALREHRPEIPAAADPKLEAGFNEKAYPSLASMFAGSRYSWIDESALDDLPAAENRLDRQFYAELWKAISLLPPSKADRIPRLFLEEAELENIVWALRLKVYYGMARRDIVGRLISLAITTGKPGRRTRASIRPRGDPDVVSAALAALAFRLDRREDWVGWKWESLLAELDWPLDLRALEAAARRRLYRDLCRALHARPFSYVPLYCFFKMKEYETASILGVMEAVHLGAPPAELASFVLSLTGEPS